MWQTGFVIGVEGEPSSCEQCDEIEDIIRRESRGDRKYLFNILHGSQELFIIPLNP